MKYNKYMIQEISWSQAKQLIFPQGLLEKTWQQASFTIKYNGGHYHPKNILRDIPEWYTVGHHMNLLPSYQKHDQLSPSFCCSGHKPCYH